MNLPTIELSALPDLGQMTGMFGSLSQYAGGYTDDRIILLMVYIYELIPLESMA